MPKEKIRTKAGRPTVNALLRRLVAENDPGELEIERVSIHLLPSGEATYRMYFPDSGDYDGGVISVTE